MIKPTITLGGTAPQDLLEELGKVRTAVGSALDAVHNYPLHPRDYANQGHFYAAMREWREHERNLTALARHVLELSTHVQDQSRRPTLNWAEAEEHLNNVVQAYTEIGPAGQFVLTVVVPPLKKRLVEGERTVDLYNEIMEVKI